MFEAQSETLFLALAPLFGIALSCRWLSIIFGMYRTLRNDRFWRRKCCYVVCCLLSTFKTLWRNPQFCLFSQGVAICCCFILSQGVAICRFIIPKALPLGQVILGFSFADLRFSLLIVPGWWLCKTKWLALIQLGWSFSRSCHCELNYSILNG